MLTIPGNILHVARPGDVIVHQVNCRRVAGAGLARQIRERYPEWMTAYLSRKAVLGAAAITRMEDGRYVADIYGQDGFGTGKRHTDYTSLQRALVSFNNLYYTVMGGKGRILIPYGMSCGLAGGVWSVVEPMIERHIPAAVLVRHRSR